MPNRTAKFVSAILASFLAGTPLATVSHGAADPADDCLSGPKGQTPQGSHWYYRIERATKRHCWYLADQREPLSQTAAPNPSASAKPLPQDAKAAMQTSVADAHAELPAQSPAELANRNAEIAPASSADAVRSEDHRQRSNAGDVVTTIAGCFALARFVQHRPLGQSFAKQARPRLQCESGLTKPSRHRSLPPASSQRQTCPLKAHPIPRRCHWLR